MHGADLCSTSELIPNNVVSLVLCFAIINYRQHQEDTRLVNAFFTTWIFGFGVDECLLKEEDVAVDTIDQSHGEAPNDNVAWSRKMTKWDVKPLIKTMDLMMMMQITMFL